MTKHKPLSLIDLFAGCGGLSLGLEQAGFMPVFVNELNEHALATYTMNREHVNPLLGDDGFHCNDVKELVAAPRKLLSLKGRIKDAFGIEKGEIDLIAGGPPCQGYSGIGHRRSYSVDREQLPSNHLYQDMAFLISKLKPRVFLFENVRGLLNARWTSTGRKGEIFEDVRETFSGLRDYRIAHTLVYAKDYGVPQNRPRVLLVGVRNDIKVQGERPDETDAVRRGFLPAPGAVAAPSIRDLLGDLVDPSYVPGVTRVTESYPAGASTDIQRSLRLGTDGRTISRKGDLLTEHVYSRHAQKIIAKFQAMLDHPRNEIPEAMRTKKFAQRVLPADWGPDGPTITATSLPDDYVHYVQPRSLTVREWARLQTFPDWYQFAGKRTTGGLRRAGNPRDGNFDREVPKYTQIGNAVPVKLAHEVGKHLATIARATR